MASIYVQAQASLLIGKILAGSEIIVFALIMRHIYFTASNPNAGIFSFTSKLCSHYFCIGHLIQYKGSTSLLLKVSMLFICIL